MTGGTLELGANAVTLGAFEQTGGTVDGTGTLTVTGAATFGGSNSWDTEMGTGKTLLDGASVITSPGNAIALDAGRTLENKGVLTVLSS